MQGKEPRHHIPGLKSSARYLNIPWLEYYSSPLYDLVVHPFPGESWDIPENQELLVTAAGQGDSLMVAYLLGKDVSPLVSDNVMIGGAAEEGHLATSQQGPSITLDYLNYINTHAPTQDRPIFTNPAVTSPALTAALDNDQLPVIQMLLASPILAPIINPLGLISAAIISGANRTLEYLLPIPPDIPIDLFNLALNRGQLGIVQTIYPYVKDKVSTDEDYMNGFFMNYSKSIWSWLLDQPEFKPSLPYYLEMAVDTNDVEMTGFLLNRTDPSFSDYQAFKDAVYANHADIVWLFLTRIDPGQIQDKHGLIQFVEMNSDFTTSQLLLADGRLFA